MKKRLLISVVFFAIGGLVWYLFLKPYEYLVTFRADTFPGTINQTVKLWSSSLNNSSIVNQSSLSSFDQELSIGNKTYRYTWQVEMLNDSTAEVSVLVTEPGNSLTNKIAIPFLSTQLEEDTENTIKSFYQKLMEHLGKFKVKVEGLATLEDTFCICMPLETDQYGKAGGMMANYSLISSFIVENDLKAAGVPFVEVTKWEKETDQLRFNFCYPIADRGSLPEHAELIYKTLEARKAIKAVYNGNYISSDRAWYALLFYAKKNSIETVDLPIEFFYNNPNFDSNELDWRAEIFLPIK